MSTETIRRIQIAIRECDRYIALESPRSADLRPKEIQERLDFYISHRVKLLEMVK